MSRVVLSVAHPRTAQEAPSPKLGCYDNSAQQAGKKVYERGTEGQGFIPMKIKLPTIQTRRVQGRRIGFDEIQTFNRSTGEILSAEEIPLSTPPGHRRRSSLGQRNQTRRAFVTSGQQVGFGPESITPEENGEIGPTGR